MTHAYSEDLVERARQNLGWMLDFAVEELGSNLTEFYQLFLSTDYAFAMSCGAVHTITGTSGFELAFNVLEDTGHGIPRFQTVMPMGYSSAFWTGWALAYFQWQSNISFIKINAAVPIEEIHHMYSPYHEMDITHFCQEMKRRIQVK